MYVCIYIYREREREIQNIHVTNLLERRARRLSGRLQLLHMVI